MTKTRLGTVVLILILLLSIVSCDRFTGSSNVAKPTRTVDFPSMVGKSLDELTTMLGPPRQQVLCYHWDLPEGDLGVCYGDEYTKKRMSSLTYELKPDPVSGSERGVGSIEEMMELVRLDTQGKGAEENHRRALFTYNDLRINDKLCFVDIHKRGPNLIFGPRELRFMAAHLYVHNPHIYLYSEADSKGTQKQFYEQQTNVDLTVGSVLLGTGNWELCTEADFKGKCKILNGTDREYLDNSKNFSAFGLGETIRSLRPVEKK